MAALFNRNRRVTRIIALAAIITTLQGCAAVMVGAGISAASVAHDRRTVGTQLDDKTLAGKVITKLANNKVVSEHANISVQVYNGIVLLVGQAPNDDIKRQAYQTTASVPHIRKIHDLVRIGSPVAASTTANDVWLASKVRAKLLTDKRIDGLHVSVTVEDSEVFLMGLVKHNEADVAVDVARNVDGVARVVKAFEYL